MTNMEIQKLKKEKKQDVKSSLLVILIMTSIISCYSQQSLIGEYIRKDEGLAVKDITSRYFFKNDGRFLK